MCSASAPYRPSATMLVPIFNSDALTRQGSLGAVPKAPLPPDTARLQQVLSRSTLAHLHCHLPAVPETWLHRLLWSPLLTLRTALAL